MMRAVRVAYVPAHLPTYEAAEHDVFKRSQRALEDRAGRHHATVRTWDRPIQDRSGAEVAARTLDAEGVDLVVLQSAAFAMGDVVLPFQERGMRICLWAAGEPRREGPIPLNSFVSMHLHAGVLRRHAGLPAGRLWWLYGDADHAWFGPRLDAYLGATAALAGVARARIGWVGGIAPSFLNVEFDRGTLARRWGAEVVPLELGETIGAAEAAPAPEVDRVVRELHEAVDGRVDVSDEDMRKGAALVIALRQLVAKHDLDALAVSDWPLFQERMRMHPGMAFTWIDESDGVPVASEGDVLGALSMLVGRLVSGRGTMLLDVNDVDLERDALLMWHCGGSPLAFADDRGARWTPHTTLGRKSDEPPLGTVADLHFRLGDVTAFRVGCSGDCVFAVDAAVIHSPYAGFDGSRGWIGGWRDEHGSLEVGEVVAALMQHGVEHHLALAEGHQATAIRAAAAWAGATVQRSFSASGTPPVGNQQTGRIP